MKEITQEQAESFLGHSIYDENAKEFAFADWKDNPHEVLLIVNQQLKEHGLQVIEVDTRGDQYGWFITALPEGEQS